MQPVVQEEVTGCGIASVAMLAGVTYEEAQRVANRLGICAADKRLWSETAYVRTLLQHYGMLAAAHETPFVTWEALPDTALLAIKWHLERGRPYWHWVVFWRRPQGAVVLDPKRALRSNVRTDFGRMHPRWYIAIQRPAAAGCDSLPMLPSP
jgi:ABC-type bacteriocin/lantibiotic exporter with double-glycine peptidase domain